MRAWVWVISGLMLALACAAAPAFAAQQPTEKDIQDQLTQMLEASFFTVSCDVPQIQPLVTPLKREANSPGTDALITKFFGSKDDLLGDESIISPIWGNGKRYKSGMVVHLVRNEQVGQRSIVGPTQKTEVVPVFLDVYPSGFVYCNNVPHTTVYATDVKPTSAETADISYHNVYDEQEGQRSAEEMITELFGQLQVPAGFQSSVQTLIQHFSERLFVYRVMPEYVTTYPTYDAEGKAVGSQPVSVPVYDSYVHVLLDGDKMICGMEYFWDKDLRPVGEPKECISAVDAVLYARLKLFEHYKKQPPLLTVTGIKLGFVHDRRDRTKLVPAWLFDSWYQQASEAKQKANTALAQPELVNVPLPFAINALTGDLFFL